MLSPSTTRYRDLAWLLILWGAAILLFCIDLGGVPLRDWDEGTVAQVAREIAQRDSWTAWLYPQLWGQPYLNKPPFLHGLIAMAFQTWEVHAWTARLPGAFLTATAVPMLYLLGREIFSHPALWADGGRGLSHPAAGGAPRSFSHAGWHHRLLFLSQCCGCGCDRAAIRRCTWLGASVSP